jgi:hypothetical protein
MSRALLILSAAAVVCASSFLALADEKGAITHAVALNDVVATQKLAAKQQEHEYRLYRHHRGYDETPSAMIVFFHPA